MTTQSVEEDEWTEAARVVIRELRAKGYAIEQGWRDIGSAPKDGTRILGCIAGGPEWYAPKMIVWAAYHPNAAGKQCWRDAPICGNKMDRVTHWKPLPEPPATCNENLRVPLPAAPGGTDEG